MRFNIDLILDCPQDKVWRAFDNLDNLLKWQPTLVSFEPLSGDAGQPGAVSKLTYNENGRVIELIETITSRNQPEEFSGTYDGSHATNTIHNQFESLPGGKTRWLMESEFQFKGFLRFMAPLIKGTIRKRLHADLGRFKTLLEAGALSFDRA